ncbi:MAG: hypothetical protein ACI4MJ_07100 [Aristaeellaceae bacterium]
MRTRYDVCMDGHPLDALDPCVYVLDVQESQPSMDVTEAKRAWGDGSRVVRSVRESLTVRVSVAIRETDVTRRREVIQRMAAWASGQYMTLGDRPGQRLRVMCTAYPAVTSALKWTQEVMMVFTAYAMPYWEAEQPTRSTFTGTVGNAAIRPMGTAPCYLEADVANAGSAAMTILSLSKAGQKLSFSGLSVAPGKVLRLFYDENWLFRAEVDGASVLSKRTADSADDLMLAPGISMTVTIGANVPVSVTLKARGLWL